MPILLIGQSTVSNQKILPLQIHTIIFIHLNIVARRKTIYEYHRMNLKNKKITNKTAIMFRPLPTCNTNTNCNSCLLSSDYDYYEDDYFDSAGKKMECRWCPSVNRCSDGTDRNRQEWVHNKCDQYNVSSVAYCSAAGHRQVTQPTLLFRNILNALF